MAERSSLVRLQREWELELEWLGYELHPDTPRGGVRMAERFPDARGMLEYVRAFAERFGIADLRPPERLASTRRALAAAHAARAAGRLEAYRAAAFDRYWRQGGGLESDEDVRALARAAGIDEAAALAAGDDPGALAEVDATRRAARAAGVTGVPTFDFLGGDGARPLRVVGCQPYETLAEAARRSGALHRRLAPPPSGGGT